MTYKLALLVLECIRKQEADGDEPYLKVNGQEVWSWRKVGRFHASLEAGNTVDAYDFRTDKHRTRDGWVSSNAYEGTSFAFDNLDAPVEIELWESDAGNALRGQDDLLGGRMVSPETVGLGQHVLVFMDEGAEYHLTVRLGDGDAV